MLAFPERGGEMSRFGQSAYRSILTRIASPGCNGIGYLSRTGIPFVNPREPFLWRKRSKVLGATLWIFVVAWIVLACDAAFGNGPRGVVPLIPIVAIILLGPLLALTARMRRPLLIRRRLRIDAASFATEVGLSGIASIRIAEAVRTAIGRIYGIPSEVVAPGDTDRSLRPFLGVASPFAFEIVLGTAILLGDQYRIEDPAIDEIIARVHDEANSVGDIARIMNEAYGGQLQSGGGIGSPMPDSDRRCNGPANCKEAKW